MLLLFVSFSANPSKDLATCVRTATATWSGNGAMKQLMRSVIQKVDSILFALIIHSIFAHNCIHVIYTDYNYCPRNV